MNLHNCKAGVKVLLCTILATVAWCPDSDAQKVRGKVWTLEQILAEEPKTPTPQDIDYCNGERFEPCVCWQDVAREMRYRPSVRECRRNAAIILSGKYRSVFSVVVRDNENRDRWPLSNYGNCTAYERDTLGLNKCSAFKVQDRMSYGPPDEPEKLEVFCLGASGYSPLFKRVGRVTAKLSDAPNSNDDPLVRWCLRSPAAPLN